MPDDLLTTSAAARHLRVSARWLRAEAEAGRVPALRAGKRFLFSREATEGELLRRARGEEAERGGLSSE